MSHSYENFLQIKDQLTENLANAIQEKLESMGPDVKGLSWFSSVAEEYNNAKNISS